LTAAATGLQDNMQALKHNFLLSGFFNRRGYDDSTQLTRHTIGALPRSAPAERIPITAPKLFAAPDSAKLKDTKALDDAGRALAAGPFGLAVVVARGGPTGDTEDLQVLAQARAMNVRDYLVSHYAMDDTRLKTFAIAKTAEPAATGSIEVLIFAPGTTGTAKPGR
jgi:outer membrane protein OmpA-like peptidoglycan-associated protein